jgi:hypothetical protein
MTGARTLYYRSLNIASTLLRRCNILVDHTIELLLLLMIISILYIYIYIYHINDKLSYYNVACAL